MSWPGSKDATRCVGYLTKYLTKHVADCHQATTDPQRAHVDQLAEALRYEPCSPRCANWLRYGIQPKNARPGLTPGACKGKAHRREHLGYAGRRVLVSRKWSGKTLADHRADRRDWLLETLGQTATDPARYSWETVNPATPTTWNTPGASSMSSPTGSTGTPPSPKRGEDRGFEPRPMIQQPERRRDVGVGATAAVHSGPAGACSRSLSCAPG